MCHYLGGGLHGRQKRVKAQSESSKSVVNSVLISREMPVFPGFLEIIRVVEIRIKKEDITGIGIAQIYGTKTAESIYNNHKYGVYICTGQCDESLIKRIGIWEALFHSELIKGLSKCHLSLKRKGTDTSSNEQLYPDTIFYLGADLDLYAVIKKWMSEA